MTCPALNIHASGYIDTQCPSAFFNDKCFVACGANYTGSGAVTCTGSGTWSVPSGCRAPGTPDPNQGKDGDDDETTSVIGVGVDKDTAVTVGSIGLGLAVLGAIGLAGFLVYKKKQSRRIPEGMDENETAGNVPPAQEMRQSIRDSPTLEI